MQTHWWLMDCSFPSLNWARLRVHVDGTADVFDMDGCMIVFPSERDAELYLMEDEYVRLDRLDTSDFANIGIPIGSLTPPVARDDAALTPLMFENRS